MSTTIVEAVARKLGGASVLGVAIRSQADLALAVRNRLPPAASRGLSRAGPTEQEIEKFVIPTRPPDGCAADWPNWAGKARSAWPRPRREPA